MVDFGWSAGILRQRIIDELADTLQLQVDSRDAHLFENASAFGDAVFSNFHSANDDIFEAATCLALDRGTACVMHLCRAVEVGLRVIADHLGLPRRNDWGKHLSDIEDELKRRYKAGSGVLTEEEKFLSEAATQIGHIKAAWRNPSMHVDHSYGPDRAKEIFAAIRSFMQHLATKLKEND